MVRLEPTAADDARDTVLLVVPGANLRDFSATPAETFVLACIDGLSSQADIAQTTGLTLEQVAGIVDRFIARGQVTFAAPFSGRKAAAPPTMQSGAYLVSGGANRPVDLNTAQQEQLLDWDRRLASLDHYELLGVARSVDAKGIRAAYFERVRVFHPDRFFGKYLGSFESKLLRVFARITEAYDTLRRPESRASYDRELFASQPPTELDFDFDPDQPPPLDSVVPSSGAVRRPSGAFVADPEARRRALARKLGHSSTPPSRSSASLAPASEPARAAEDLKQRYSEQLVRAREEQIAHYVLLSKEAAASNDLTAAANALRVACSLSPDNLALARDLADLEQRAAQGMWESYADRAKYAALEGNSLEAAQCYERAALGHPSPSLLERAAYHTLEANGDLKHAAHLARQAVAMSPNSAKCRLTLAQIYASAKLRESALAELERARALEPDQPLIKEWIMRVKRGDI